MYLYVPLELLRPTANDFLINLFITLKIPGSSDYEYCRNFHCSAQFYYLFYSCCRGFSLTLGF